MRQVAHLFPTAIISGRGRDKVEAFVQLPELFYAGSHGMDIAGPRVSSHPTTATAAMSSVEYACSYTQGQSLHMCCCLCAVCSCPAMCTSTVTLMDTVMCFKLRSSQVQMDAHAFFKELHASSSHTSGACNHTLLRSALTMSLPAG